MYININIHIYTFYFISIITKRSILDVAASLDPPLEAIVTKITGYHIYIYIYIYIYMPIYIDEPSEKIFFL